MFGLCQTLLISRGFSALSPNFFSKCAMPVYNASRQAQHLQDPAHHKGRSIVRNLKAEEPDS